MNTFMKTSALAVAFTLTAMTATADVAFVGGAEYAVETEVTEANVGVEFVTGAVTVVPTLTGTYDSTNEFVFTGVEATATYVVIDNVSVYAIVDLDADVEYEDVTVGVSFRF